MPLTALHHVQVACPAGSEDALREAYPQRPDGTTLLPFRRIFAVGSRPS